ncbi:mitochondrial Rho GTPase 1-like isoform X2 [Corylus avellana]|uniref:mitochondrial Rho GTPase 1-like isoform X2 n=1 Tax=Corylus avellana TaxID=13451 RepID=UPI00286B5E98|nr:mitochondrial Rho GTPase 1-like isoform X2 [Corylus avellana]
MAKVSASGTNPYTKTGIRIVVAGDRGTGKSSLIATVEAKKFITNVPPVLPPTRLPDNFFSDFVPITIIDTSSRVVDDYKVAEELKQADAVVFTYACDEPSTLDRLSTFWLPKLCKLEVKVPVIVVGCKLDLKDENQNVSLERVMSPITEQFREIDTGIECSALKLRRIPEVFYCAQKAVLNPTGPLLNHKTLVLRPRCVRALKRIFILCDHDRDGALSDAELNDFQVKCMNSPLQPSEIVGVKCVVAEQLPEGVDERGLTLMGFLFLHTLFIKNGQTDAMWTVLRTFGYNNDIKLAEDLIPSSFKRAPDQSVELTNEAIEYLRGIVELELHNSNTLCVTRDGELGSHEIDDIFSTAAERKRHLDRKKQQTDRNVFQCFVFGPKKAGKSALLNSFLGRPFSDKYTSTIEDHYAVNVVDEPIGTKKTLVLREIPEDGVSKMLLDKESLAACDVAVFVHDSSNALSWERATELLVEVASHGKDTGFEVPCLIVAAKDDLDSFSMARLNSTRVSEDMGIVAPIPISTKFGDLNNVFLRIVSAAEHPHLSIPQTEAGRSLEQYQKLIDRTVVDFSDCVMV